MKKTCWLIALAIITTIAFAQEKEKKEWDVNNPPGPHTEKELTFTEGTWMNLDVSPDGKTIAFDLLGDIYTMPIRWNRRRPANRSGLGSTATLQPRWPADLVHQ
jgi:hypothetical protein